MKVKELIEKLKELNPESVVMMELDSEGNRYNYLCGVDIGIYKDDEMYSLEWTADECCFEEDEWSEIKLKKPICAILFP